MVTGIPAGWLTLQQAGERSGVSDQTIRSWIDRHFDDGEVLDKGPGRRPRYFVQSQAVDRLAGQFVTTVRANPVPTSEPRTELAGGTRGDTLARVALLDDVLRRQRIIDEHRQSIELLHAEVVRLHGEIEREQRQINELLLGPMTIPNH